MSTQQTWLCLAVPAACKHTPMAHHCSQPPDLRTATGEKKKKIQHAIKGIMVTTALLLANAISVYFLDPLVIEGVAYWGGIKEGSTGRKQCTRWLRRSSEWREREKKKEEEGMNGQQYTRNFTIMLSTWYKYAHHPQKCFLNRRLHSRKARASTGPN